MDEGDVDAERHLIDGLGLVDEWSAQVYGLLATHPLALAGVWTHEEPDSLMLTINSVQGEPVELIVMSTCESEITLSFGGWHTHLPAEALDAPGAVNEAVALIDRWLSNDLRTLVFWMADGAWAGAVSLSNNEWVQANIARSDWLNGSAATRCELRTPRRSGWTYFAKRDGDWVELPEGSTTA
jgi:hypothetical protein